MDFPENEANETYKKIIDQLVNETTSSISARLVRQESIYSRSLDAGEENKFVSGLKESDREILARMLEEERKAAIHDVLADFTWWIDAQNVEWSVNGTKMKVDLSGMGLHGDYIGRLDDWEWPD
jgi:hypothetical protein